MDVKVTVVKEFDKVLRAAEKANDWSLRRAGAYLRGVAMRGIKVSKEPSLPGSRPHTRKGLLKKSIIFAVEQKGVNVLIGPGRSWIGRIGATHEFGGTEPAKKTGEGMLDASGRPIKVPGTNWRLGPGGFGPIEDRGLGKFRYAQLFTMAQVRRSQRIAEENIKGLKFRGKKRTYPKRAFMRPTLDLSLPTLPQYWTSSVRG